MLILKKFFDEVNNIFKKLDLNEFIFKYSNNFSVVCSEVFLKYFTTEAIQGNILGLVVDWNTVGVVVNKHGWGVGNLEIEVGVWWEEW